MPHPAIEPRPFKTFLDHDREPGRNQLLEKVEITTHTRDNLQAGVLRDEIHQFIGHHVLVTRVGFNEIGNRLLRAIPAPEGERHRKVGWPAVIPLLVFVADAGELDLIGNCGRDTGRGRCLGWDRGGAG
jgi:hypothetical protein